MDLVVTFSNGQTNTFHNVTTALQKETPETVYYVLDNILIPAAWVANVSKVSEK